MTHRIVSLIASATEIVCALGFEDALVGRSHECDYPPSVARLPVCSTSKVKEAASSEAIDRQVRLIVGEGLSVYQVDPDLLNRLAPTVIVTQTQCDVCAVSLKELSRRCATSSARVLPSYRSNRWRWVMCGETAGRWRRRLGSRPAPTIWWPGWTLGWRRSTPRRAGCRGALPSLASSGSIR